MVDNDPSSPNFGLETDQTSPNFGLAVQEPKQESVVGNALAGASDVLKGFAQQFVPKFDLKTLAGLAYEPINAQIQGYNLLKSIVDTGKQVQEAEKTPPFSRERFAAGFNVVGQLGLLAAGGRAPKLAEIAGIKKPITAEATPQTPEPLASEVAAQEPIKPVVKPVEEVIPNAVQEPSTGEVLQRQPQEAGAPGGERVGVEQGVQGQETPQASTEEVAAVPPEQPKIVGAAIQDATTGKTFTGPSHPQIYDKFPQIEGDPGEAFTGEGWNTGGNYIDGFVDQNGKFYDREEAAVLVGLPSEASMGELESVAGKIPEAPYKIIKPSPQTPEGGRQLQPVDEPKKGVGGVPQPEQPAQDWREGFTPKGDYPVSKASIDKAFSDYPDKPKGWSQDRYDTFIKQRAGAIEDEVRREAARVSQVAESTTVEPKPKSEVGVVPQETGTGGVSAAILEERPINAPPPGEGVGWEETRAFGNEWLDKGGNINKVIADFNRTGKVDEWDVGKGAAYLERLQAATDRAKDALRENPSDPVLQNQHAVALAQEQRFTDAYRPMATTASNTLKGFQGKVPLTDDMADSLSALERKYGEIQGKQMTPEEVVKADRLVKQNAKAKTDVQEATNELYRKADVEYGRIRSERAGPPTLEDIGRIFGEKLKEVCEA